jgi:hypothetical protein
MKLLIARIFWATLLVALLLLSDEVPAQQGANDARPSESKIEESIAAPELSDLVPSATELSRRLDLLVKRISDELDVSVVEKSYAEILTNLEAHSSRIKKLKAAEDYRYSELIELKTAIVGEAASLHALSEPLAKGIREIESARKEWAAEKKKWSAWKVSLLEDKPLKVFLEISSLGSINSTNGNSTCTCRHDEQRKMGISNCAICLVGWFVREDGDGAGPATGRC